MCSGEPLVHPQGTASDDTAVDRVQIAVRDRDAGLCWDPETAAWQGSLVWIEATLDTAGAAATGCSYAFGAADPGARYWVQARAIDSSGNTDPSKATLAIETAA